MMSARETERLINEALELSSETNSVEFKDARGGFPRDIWKTVSSFSQKPGGGCIVFGVEEKRSSGKSSVKIVGGVNFADIQEKMAALCSQDMNITIRANYHHLTIDAQEILAVTIPECPNQFKPCYYKQVGLPNGAYIRDGNSDRKITDEEMRQLLDNARLSKFDSSQALGTVLGDISMKKVYDLLIHIGQRTQRDAHPEDVDFELLKNLGVGDVYDQEKSPTLAGFLIFSKKPPQEKRAFNRYVIRCVRYKGSSVTTDIIDSADIGGTLDEQIDGMQKFILRNIRKGAEIVGTKRVERYEYPEKAIREIVANAVIHRDYEITETYTQVNVFEDRVEVTNPGCLPPGVTVDNIRDAQVSRNEIIAARLKDLDYLEEYGRGINIVFEEMGKWNLLSPIFKNTTNSFKVILPGESLSKLNERQLVIWEYLIEHQKVTAKTCQEKILLGVPRQTINYDLSRMQDLGLIHSVGKSVNTYYESNF